MSTPHDTVSTQGLVFFGNMTASISHEIKNALAIVNENAGLLSDLTLMMEKGRPLSPERLQTLSGNIRRQVQRADLIIRRLNRFAHSAHEPAAQTSLHDIFTFTIELTARLALMKGVTVAMAQEEPVQLTIQPFVLENLLWICLNNVLAVTEGKRAVELGAAATGSGVTIRIELGQNLPVHDIGKRVASEGQALLEALHATIDVNAEETALRITLPE